MNDAKSIIQTLRVKLTEIENKHPYKVPGEHDTYSKYNEGWCDALSCVECALDELDIQLLPGEAIRRLANAHRDCG